MPADSASTRTTLACRPACRGKCPESPVSNSCSAKRDILFEDMTLSPRRIYTDGRDWPKDLKTREPTFVGYSLGKWLDTAGDGRYDTLEIETRHVRGPRTWDQTRIPMADDNEAVFSERIYLDENNPNILHDENTATDTSLTRPRTATKNYRRQENVTWEENNCVEGNAYITINKQVYVLGGDGLRPQHWRRRYSYDAILLRGDLPLRCHADTMNGLAALGASTLHKIGCDRSEKRFHAVRQFG